MEKNLLIKITVGILTLVCAVIFFYFGKSIFMKSDEHSIDSLLHEKPVNKTVKITGKIVRVMRDYKGKKGDKYFQFYLSDGESQIKVFCKRTDQMKFEVEDEVEVMGKFIKFGKTYEIAYCNKPYGYVKFLN